MKTRSIALKLALAISAFGLFAALPAMAQTAPALRLTAGLNTITIDANNVITPTLPDLGCAACTTDSSSGVAHAPGSVMWSGTIGGFTVVAQGNSGSANPDLAVTASYNGTGSATLTVSWTSTGYTGSIIAEGVPGGATPTGGAGSVTYSYYTDNTNAVFGTGSLIGTLPGTTVSGPVWPTTTTATGTYSITEVEAITLASGASFNGDNELATAAEPLTITCAQSNGVVGTPYSSSVTAAKGTPNYTFSIIAGALAPGLTLNASTGAVTGTPSSAIGSPFSYTVEVVDANGTPAISSCSQTITVGGGGGQSGLTLACPSTTGLTQGAYYSSSFVATGGVGKETFSITAGSLPAGLKYNAFTGAVYGTPTGTGSFSFTGKVVDSSSPTRQTATSAACTGTIAPKPTPLSLTCATSKGTVGTPYSSAVVASGGTPPYVSYKVTSGSLPPGLTLNQTSGAITGTPTTAGTYSYTVQVIDTNGAKASDGSGSGRCSSSGCSITIAGPTPLTLKCPTSTAKVGVAYSSVAPVTGGTAPFTYSVSAGSLPAGLTLNTSSGAITGTPTTSGTSNFTLKVKDASGKTDDTSDCSGGCSITVAPAISITCPTSSATLGKSYSSTPTVTGGTAAYTWSVASGSLPPGLSLNTSTGAITGTPTKAGTYTLTLKVVDKNGLVGVSSCGSCSTNSNSGWGSGWGWWNDDDSNDTNCSCTITVTDPNANSNCGTGNDGSAAGSGWGWGW